MAAQEEQGSTQSAKPGVALPVVLSIRASEMDRVCECPGSIRTAGESSVASVRSDVGDGARIGQAVHAMMWRWLTTGSLPNNNKGHKGCHPYSAAQAIGEADLMDMCINAISVLGEVCAMLNIGYIDVVVNSGTVEVNPHMLGVALPAASSRRARGFVEHPVSAILSDARADTSPESPRVSLTGTADVVLHTPDEIVVLDWKTDQTDQSHRHQMASYAACVAADAMYRPGVGGGEVSTSGAWLRRVFTVVVNVRTAMYDVTEWDAGSVANWVDGLFRNVIGQRDHYGPGGACTYCPKFDVCPAREQAVRSVVSALCLTPEEAESRGVTDMVQQTAKLIASANATNKNDPMIGATLSQLIHQCRLVEQAVASAKQQIRDLVARVGEIDLHDGSSLKIRTIRSQEIDPIKGIKALRKLMEAQTIYSSVKISLPKLVEAFRRTQVGGAPQGTSGCRRIILDELRAADAVREVCISRLERSAKVTPTDAEKNGGPGCGAESEQEQ